MAKKKEKLQERSKRRIRKYFGKALERFLRWADDEGRQMREDDAADSALVEFLNHREFLPGLQVWEGDGLLANLALLLAGVRQVAEGGGSLAVCQRIATCASRKEPRNAHPHDVAEHGGGSSSGRIPPNGNLPYNQRVGVCAPVRGAAPHAYQRVAAHFGRQRILELLATPGGGATEVKNWDSRRFHFATASRYPPPLPLTPLTAHLKVGRDDFVDAL